MKTKKKTITAEDKYNAINHSVSTGFEYGWNEALKRLNIIIEAQTNTALKEVLSNIYADMEIVMNMQLTELYKK